MKRRIFALSVLALAVNQAVYAADEPDKLPEVNVTATATSAIEGYVTPVASTATKTDTPLMETPMSIQVVPQQVLQDQKATTLDQALTNVSGVLSNSKMYNGWAEQIYLRGFSTNTTFRDGFRIDDPGGWNGTATLSNIDSIEVLKGPAAILYGRVEPGGVVNLVTKKPQDTPYYSFEQSVGSWDHYITSFDATNALNDDKTLLYRLNASYDTSQSWREGINDKNTFIAPTVLWKLSPQTQVTLDASYRHNPKVIDLGYYPVDQTTNQFAPVAINKDPIPLYYTADTTYYGITWSHQFNQDWTIKQQLRHNEVDGTYPLQPVVGSIYQNGNVWTFDRALIQISPLYQTINGTVLDLTGHFTTSGLEHTLLTGMDYYRLKAIAVDAASAYGSSTTWINPAPPTGLVVDPTLAYATNTTTNNFGAYMQDQIKLPHNVFLLAGFRYQDVKQSGVTTNGTAQSADTPQHDSATTPRFGILWQARDWLSIYGSYAENFGANNGLDWQGNPLPPEGAKQNEIGTKAEFFGGKLISSLALYDLTKTNVAVCDVLNDPTCTLGYQTTVGAINSRGVEFDMQGEIQPRWNAIVSYTYDRVIISQSTPGSYYTQGNYMANDPLHMVHLWNTYALRGESLDGWKIGGGVTWRDSSLDVSNTVVSPSYVVWDAMASYETKLGKQKTTFQLNIKNLFDEVYYTGATIYGAYGTKQYGDPRSAMASLKLEY